MKRWRRRSLSAVFAALALVVVWTTPALAETCSSIYAINGDVNNTFKVCATRINNGYDAKVVHYAGPTYLVDFNLITTTGTYGDDGAFYISAGETRTYFFAVGYKSSALVRLYWRAGNPYFGPLDAPICSPYC